MSVDPGTFEAFYASFVQHPLLLWLAAIAGVIAALARRGVDRTLRRYCFVLCALSLLDAWWTASPVVGFGSLDGWAASAVPLFFVLAGDYRFLLLAVAGTPRGRLRIDARKLCVAVALTLMVPVASRLVTSVLPGSIESPRILYLIYEVAFFAWTSILMRRLPNLRTNPWLLSVSRFVLVYYGLWASADALLLVSGADIAFLLRVVPNLLYYGGLIAAIAWFAPTDEGFGLRHRDS